MKSSKKKRRLPERIKNEFLSNGPVYSLLVLYMPLAVIIALVFLLRASLPIPIPTAMLLICGVLAALSASFYCDFMKDNKSSHAAANVRGGFIVMAVFYVLSSLFSLEIPLKTRFLPNLINVLVSIETLYMWSSVITLKQIFSARRSFETYTELYQGEELQRVIREDSALLQYTDLTIAKTRGNYLSQLIFVCIITLVVVSFKISLPPALYLLLVVIMAGGICISAFFGIIRWEHYYAGEGLTLSAADRFQRMIGIGIFTVLFIVVAILLSSNKSILPFSLITGFLVWVLGLFRRITMVGEALPPEIIESLVPEPPLLPSDMLAEEIVPWPFWKWLRYGFIAIVAALFIWFMISPLFNRGEDPNRLTFLKRLKRIITEWFKGLISFIAYLAEFIKSGKSLRKLRKPGDEEIRRAAESIFGAYSLAKKRDMRQSVTLFARLIIWGADVRSVTWKPSLAPGEYCNILAASDNRFILQRQNEGIVRCGELFEQALYSAEVLSNAERKEFKDLVEEITAVSE